MLPLIRSRANGGIHHEDVDKQCHKNHDPLSPVIRWINKAIHNFPCKVSTESHDIQAICPIFDGDIGHHSIVAAPSKPHAENEDIRYPFDADVLRRWLDMSTEAIHIDWERYCRQGRCVPDWMLGAVLACSRDLYIGNDVIRQIQS